uniref:Uncharacterized protein n=1 Tax=Rhizophora mucronata TaxID=61149 RepID=A0A2P2PLJ0_RHIMU
MSIFFQVGQLVGSSHAQFKITIETNHSKYLWVESTEKCLNQTVFAEFCQGRICWPV